MRTPLSGGVVRDHTQHLLTDGLTVVVVIPRLQVDEVRGAERGVLLLRHGRDRALGVHPVADVQLAVVPVGEIHARRVREPRLRQREPNTPRFGFAAARGVSTVARRPAMVQTGSIAAGATMPGRPDARAAASSTWIGLVSPIASTQRRIIGRFTGSTATCAPVDAPTNDCNRSYNALIGTCRLS